MEPGGFPDTMERESESARLEKFVDGETAAGPGVVVVKGNEAARGDGIVERVEAELDGFVPVGVDIEKSDLRDADGGKGLLEQAGNDADAGEVGAGAAKEPFDAHRAGLEVADPTASFGAVDVGGGRHAGEDVEKPEGAGKAGMRGGAGEKRGGAAFVDAAFDEVARDLIVLDALGEPSEVLDAIRGDHGALANEARAAVFGETSDPSLQQARMGTRRGRQRWSPCD